MLRVGEGRVLPALPCPNVCVLRVVAAAAVRVCCCGVVWVVARFCPSYEGVVCVVDIVVVVVVVVVVVSPGASILIGVCVFRWIAL